MQVDGVISFIADCRAIGSLSKSDSDLLDALYAHFSMIPTTTELSPADITRIVLFYQRRWEIDSEKDSTLYPRLQINKLLIEFAKRLAQNLADKHSQEHIDAFNNALQANGKKDLPTAIESRYIYLVIPIAVNNKDYNDLAKLTETRRFGNYFIGLNGILYRKRSFCEWLQKNNYQLSIRRQMEAQSPPSAVSIRELARIRRCEAETPAFEVGTETFDDFWDLLNKKVFGQLQKSTATLGEAGPLCNMLFTLIESYFKCKYNDIDYADFKKEYDVFDAKLVDLDVDTVNYFYGIDVENNVCLINYLVDIFLEKDFTPKNDSLILAIQKRLCTLSPIAKTRTVGFELISTGGNRSEPPRRIAPVAVTTSPIDYYAHPCWRALLSLFVIKFAMISITNKTISLWDVSNSVPDEGFNFYHDLLSKINVDDGKSIIVRYNSLINTHINPALSFGSRVVSETVREWLVNMSNGNIATMVNWFEPEYYLEVFSSYSPQDDNTAEAVKGFVNELIRIYAQDSKNTIYKRIRVNIGFAKLEKQLDVRTFMELKILIKLQETPNAMQDAWKKFNANCIKYIKRQLAALGMPVTQLEEIDAWYQKQMSAPSSSTSTPTVTFNNIISACKNILNGLAQNQQKGKGLPSPAISEDTILGISTYLSSIYKPILNVNETSQNAGHSVGVFGAPM